MQEWHRQRAETFRFRDSLPADFPLHPREKQFFDSMDDAGQSSGVDFAVTPYFLSLAGDSPDDPIRRQCIPDERELTHLPWEDEDPLYEGSYTVTERMVHRYRDRVLILVTDECAMYCRHCFRRYFSSRKQGVLGETRLQESIHYLIEHPEIHEVILSGGDPLTLEDNRLLHILDEIYSKTGRPLVFRLASRIPVVLPQRITPELVSIMRRFSPLYLVTQFNHVREISPESRRAVAALVDAGIPVLNQAVLLRGRNDTVKDLGTLFQTLLEIRVKPYYLFQGDLAVGTSHFRVPLEKALALYRSLRGEISGLAMPVFALDLPGGGGKVPVMDTYLDRPVMIDGRRQYRFTAPDGKYYYYPVE